MWHLTQILGQPSATLLSGLVSQLQCMMGDFFTSHVGRHDEDGVLAFDGFSFTVRQTTLQ